MSARNPNGADIKVSNPSKGLVTRIPSDQPSERKMPNAWVEAQNVRFDDGVIRNAPGYEDVYMMPIPETPILGIFQEQLLQDDRPPFKDIILITGDKIYWVQRSTYTFPDILALSIDLDSPEGTSIGGTGTVGHAGGTSDEISSEESVPHIVVVATGNGYIVPDSIVSTESVSTITIT